MTTSKISVSEFAEIFGGMTPRIEKKIGEFPLEFTYLSPSERDECLLKIVSGLVESQFEVVGAHRQEKWEKGWGENLEAFKKGEKDGLVPYYFQKDAIARWRQEFVRPVRKGFDYGALTIILEWLYERYMSDVPAVYEFGCGTGHHLLQLHDVNREAKLFGLDWAEASQKIIAEMVSRGQLKNAEGRRFDFFAPDHSFDLLPGAVAYTVAALEQVGDQHEAFVEYLLEKKPKLCVHVEPIAEVLDQNNLLDYLSIKYFEKRNYLKNFLTHLQLLESQGRVKIHDARRTYLGGNMYVDHYSVVVWSPVP